MSWNAGPTPIRTTRFQLFKGLLKLGLPLALAVFAMIACTTPAAERRVEVFHIVYGESLLPNACARSTNSEVSAEQQCCKVCSVGVACGNSCISAAYTCHKGLGCACNSAEVRGAGP